MSIENKIPASLKESLKKAGLDIEVYGRLFLKCSTPQVLKNDEFIQGCNLMNLGFMVYKSKPFWKGHSFEGHDITFTRYIPIYD